MRTLCLLSLLVAILLPESARGEFAFQEYKDRLSWIWESPTKAPAPAVADKEWPTDEIDAFILAALEESAMSPAPPASDRHWFRRVNFAITGLPPTPEATEEFLSNADQDRRKSAVLDLLASPHYGERWARHWMDLVRYAESRGHESDFGIANAWRYRDYLVRAFNADVPYNDFVTEHIAGDLLAAPRLDPQTKANESILATGWPFLGEEVHSPVDIRQDECDRTDNKIDVLSKTFLGLTVACARCHDHMFDAIYQKDYYALSGFVASSSYRQVRYESIEVNKAQARKLTALRAKTATQVLKNFAREAEPHFVELSKQPTYRVPGPFRVQPEEGQDVRVIAVTLAPI